jgi:hypothetical protein
MREEVPSDTGLPGYPDEAHPSYGDLTGICQTLAYQLRESIVHDVLDEALLTVIEWNLDRHHTRVVIVLSEILREDAEFLEHAQRMLNRLTTAAVSSKDISAQYLLRFERILRVVHPRLVGRASWDKAAKGAIV